MVDRGQAAMGPKCMLAPALTLCHRRAALGFTKNCSC